MQHLAELRRQTVTLDGLDFDADVTPARTRREFLRTASLVAAAPMLAEARRVMAAPVVAGTGVDAARMRSLADWTALSFDTPHPTVYGAAIFDTTTGEELMRALNAVGAQHDPSAHGEIVTIRLACAKLEKPSLKGYTLYTTCEPCPMCMACCLWAGLDRVVYGATIDDAAKFGNQIMIYSADVKAHWKGACVVDGPVDRERCAALFSDPKLLAARAKRKPA